ncbi:4-(cytidine 5'-diphospho)-2-C-methyl-D-erythritol kinase [Chloroflexota bacterium]
MLTLQAPAKINLTLEVLAKRRDGYHEVRSVIQTINLCDSLRFRQSQNIKFKSSTSDWTPERSLISKAASLLKEDTGCSRGAIIEVDKHIPLMAGLGGDSSDAAAVLRGLNKLWGLGLSPEKLHDLAAQLGSDVPFFLHGGTALAKGRGEMLTPLPPLPRMWVVLVMPSVPRVPGKTERLYASLKASHYTDGQFTERLTKELRDNGEFTPSLLFNTFENIAFARSSEISVYRSHILKVGAADVHLAGSGPALFTLIKDKTLAEDLHLRLQQQRLESYLIETLE